jgi:hypothetical protein
LNLDKRNTWIKGRESRQEEYLFKKEGNLNKRTAWSKGREYGKKDKCLFERKESRYENCMVERIWKSEIIYRKRNNAIRKERGGTENVIAKITRFNRNLCE